MRRILESLLLLSLMVSTAAVADPVLHSNSVKYAVKPGAFATGKAGSATLNARALLGKDGVTTLELSTADFESGVTAPGSIDQVQVKLLDTQGQPFWVRNFNEKGGLGTVAHSFTDLSRRMPLAVQANVSGIDGNRSDRVAVTTQVERRPDVAVTNILGSPNAVVNVPMHLEAVLRELNGDVGAKGDCVLYVDGVSTDKAAGIWVNAGDSVSCIFTETFATDGAKDVRIQFENQEPADWDTSNNVLDFSVHVVEPTEAIVGARVDAGGDHYEAHDIVQTWYSNTPITSDTDFSRPPDIETDNVENGNYLSEGVQGYSFSVMAFPLIKVAVKVTSGGAVYDDQTVENVQSNYGNGSCYRSLPRWSDSFWNICSGLSTPSGFFPAVFTLVRTRNHVTYLSREFLRHWWNGTSWQDGDYYIETPGDPATEPDFTLGTDLTVDATIIDATGKVFHVSGVAPFDAEPYSDVGSAPCHDSPFYDVYQHVCETTSRVGVSRTMPTTRLNWDEYLQSVPTP